MAIITTLVIVWPTKNTIIGASATMGIVWLAMTYGETARSKNPKWTKATDRATPMAAPRANPMAASRHVYRACQKRYAPSDSVVPALSGATWPPRPPTRAGG